MNHKHAINDYFSTCPMVRKQYNIIISVFPEMGFPITLKNELLIEIIQHIILHVQKLVF